MIYFIRSSISPMISLPFHVMAVSFYYYTIFYRYVEWFGEKSLLISILPIGYMVDWAIVVGLCTFEGVI